MKLTLTNLALNGKLMLILVSFIFIACPKRSNAKPNYCRINSKHILCGRAGFSPKCGNRREVKGTKVSEGDKKVILKAHNDFRMQVANGKAKAQGKPFPKAANMMQLLWDDELASVASTYVKNCALKHSCGACRRVERFKTGENIFFKRQSRKPNRLDWAFAISSFIAETKDYNVRDIGRYRRTNKVIGHLTQVIWGNVQYVGCGYVIYKKGRSYDGIGICVYGPAGNYLGEPVYEVGRPCSKCPNRRRCSKRYKGLCA